MALIVRSVLLLCILVPLLHAGEGAPVTGMKQGQTVQFRILRSSDPFGYYIRIQYKGIAPEGIRITPQRGSVRIHTARQEQKREVSDNGSIRYFSSGQEINSVVAIPPDGDLSRLGRNDKPGVIEVVIPRKRR